VLVGRKNRHCLCETCEQRGRGGYAPVDSDEPVESSSDSDDSSSDSDSDSSDTSEDTEDGAKKKVPLNLNERRTRRGVYAVTREESEESDESEEENTMPLADRKDIPEDGEVELESAMEVPRELTPESVSQRPSSSTLSQMNPPNPPSPSPKRDYSPASSVSTDTPIEWNQYEADAAKFDPSLTPEQRDRLRRKRKRLLWQRTRKSLCIAINSTIADSRYRQYKRNLVKLRLNTPPPPPPEPTRRVTRSISALTPSKTPTTRKTAEGEPSPWSLSAKGKEKEMATESPTPARGRQLRRGNDRNRPEPTQLVTPPLSEETTSLPDASASASRRVTRSTISSSAKDSAKEPERSGVTTRSKGKEKEEKLSEEPESKVLRRTRPSPPTNQSNTTKEGLPTPKREVPRGPDGKPLPTCATCHNILPVISVDSHIVWGLGAESSPRRGKKKKEKQECPRFVS
jgi:[histone H4]-N-methyl-L-lysine20 N-methyltransferase